MDTSITRPRFARDLSRRSASALRHGVGSALATGAALTIATRDVAARGPRRADIPTTALPNRQDH